jgi:RNA polymerase-binding transcription factor DksA
MTKHQREKYRDQLRALVSRLGGTISSLEANVRTPTGGQTAGGLSNAPLHLGDVGTDVFNQELDATIMENEGFIRNEAVAALNRIDRGTFGKCENCGRAIGAERLDALPYARHCAPCAARVQSGRPVNLNDGRPAGWLGTPGHESANQTGSPVRIPGYALGTAPADTHAAGTPGGGTGLGGLAGTNAGDGDPSGAGLERAMGSSDFDVADEADEEGEAYSGPSGGAVGGTPANKRARGGKSANGPTRKTTPQAKKTTPRAKAAPKKRRPG